MIRKLLLPAFLLAASLFAGATEGIRVRPYTGDAVTFRFDSQPEVSFLGSKLQIKTADSPAVTFELDNIESIEFAKVSGAELPADGGIVMSVDAEAVRFANIAEDAQVLLVDLAGHTLLSQSCSGGEFAIRRADYPHGVYVVKIDGFTSKVIL